MALYSQSANASDPAVVLVGVLRVYGESDDFVLKFLLLILEMDALLVLG